MFMEIILHADIQKTIKMSNNWRTKTELNNKRNLLYH